MTSKILAWLYLVCLWLGAAAPSWGMTSPALPSSFTPTGRTHEFAPTNYGLFFEPLVAVREVTDGEVVELGAAVNAYRQGAEQAAEDPDAYAKFDPLWNYMSSHPESPWRMSLLANIGLRLEQLGYVDGALDAEAKALSVAAGPTFENPDWAPRQQRDAVLADELRLEAGLGHLQRALEIEADPRMASLQGSAHVRALAASWAVNDLRDDPQHARRCGWVALTNLMRQLGATKERLDDLQGRMAGPDGTTLAQLAHWADESQAGLTPVRLSLTQDVPTPAVVHMKSGHFATLTRIRGSGMGLQYLLVDPVLGGERWISARALTAESSGYFLMAQSAAAGMQRIAASEATQVRGSGNPGTQDNAATSGVDNQSATPCPQPPAGEDGLAGANGTTQGSGPPSPCDSGSAASLCGPLPPSCGDGNAAAGQPSGMPTYSVQSLTIGLSIHDTPLAYAPAIGPAIGFSVFYSQAEAYQPATFTFSNLGAKWTHNWLAYITDDPTQVGVNVSLYQRTGGDQSYSGYNAGTGSFTQEPRGPQLFLVSVSPVSYERRFADGSKEVYAASDGTQTAGRHVFLTKVVDSYGNAVKLSYDGLMRLTTITDALGQATTVGYGSPTSLRIKSVTDPWGRNAQFGYQNGLLQSITDELPMSSSFGYDGNGNVNSMTTPYGPTKFKFQTGKFDRWIEITDPLNYTERVEYNSDGSSNISYSGAAPQNMNISKDVVYRNTFYWDKATYPSFKNPDGTINWQGATIIKHWAEYTTVNGAAVAPVLLATRTPMNANTEWEWYLYPGMGSDGKTLGSSWMMNMTGRVLPDGTSRVTSVTYNPLGLIASITDPVGRTTTYTYDPANNIDLLKVTQSNQLGSAVIYQASNYTAGHEPQTVIDASGQTWLYTYNSAGQLLTVQNPLKQTTTYNYNSVNQLVNIVNANQVKQVKFAYDGFGRVQTVTDSEGYTKTIGYDNLNRVTSVTYPDQSTDITHYNNLDVDYVVDRLQHKTSFDHDADRRMYHVRDANLIDTYFGYDNDGRLTSYEDGNQHTTQWILDAEGRVGTKQYPSGEGYSVSYDSAGREYLRTDTAGGSRNLSYYQDGTIQKVTYSGAVTDKWQYIYDPLFPRLSSMSDLSVIPNTVISFGYVPSGTNGAGQLASESSNLSQQLPIGYGYDELGRPKTRSVGGNSQSWNYDLIGRLQTDTNLLGQFTYSYLGQTSQPLTETLASAKWNTVWNWYPNLQDRMLESITHPISADAAPRGGINWLDLIARWMGLNVGMPAPEVPRMGSTPAAINYSVQTGMITGRSQGSDSWTYKYDNANRLTSAAYTGTGTGQGAQYTPDNADFLAQIATTNPSSTLNFVPNSDNQVTSTNGATNASWIYDQMGNVTDDGVNTYNWDVENRLIRIVNKSNGHVSGFAYDGLGRLMAIQESSGNNPVIWPAWCQGRATPCGAAFGAGTALFYAQGEVNPADTPSQFYYARDQLGSVMETVDANGNVLAGQEYAEYGRTYNAAGTPAPTIGFAGMLLHQPSGIYLTPNRMYSSVNGRWYSRDPIGEIGGANVYAYAGNPIAFIDPFGLDWQGSIGVSGTLFGLTVGGGGGTSIGLSTDGTLAGTYFFASGQVNVMGGLGAFAGVGAVLACGHTNGPPAPGTAQGLYAEGDMGAGEATSLGVQMDFEGNPSTSGGGPFRFTPGAGFGIAAGAGVFQSTTVVSPSLRQMFDKAKSWFIHQ